MAEIRDESTSGLGDTRGRELTPAESEQALREAFEQARKTILGEVDPVSVLRLLAEDAITTPSGERSSEALEQAQPLTSTERDLLLRLAELLEQSTSLAALAQKPLGDPEPLFVLRGRDKLAPIAVRHWAALAATQGAGQRLESKLQTAQAIAVKMDLCPDRRMPGL